MTALTLRIFPPGYCLGTGADRACGEDGPVGKVIVVKDGFLRCACLLCRHVLLQLDVAMEFLRATPSRKDMRFVVATQVS